MTEQKSRPGLDVYWDGKIYDLQNVPVDDVPFWLGQADRLGDPVLELACGTGRVALPLARAGHDVTGLDVEAAMLDCAREKADAEGVSVAWVLGDCTRFSLGRRFRLILMPFNSVAHLYSRDDVDGCLECVRKHLAPGGRFIVSLFNPDFRYFLRNPNQREPSWEYCDPETGHRIDVEESNRYDRATQVNHIVWRYKNRVTGDTVERRLPMRIFYPQELDGVLHYNGFVVEEKLGSFDGEPFESTSSYQIAICRPR